MSVPAENDQPWPSSPFRWLWAASATSLIGSEIGELAVPLFALLVLDAGASDLAWVRVVAGVGALFGAALSGWATRPFGYGRSLVVTTLIGNSAPLALALNSEGSLASWVPSASALGLAEFGVGLANAQAVTVRQLATPPGMRERVNAGYRFLS